MVSYTGYRLKRRKLLVGLSWIHWICVGVIGRAQLRCLNTIFKFLCLIHHYFLTIYDLVPVFLQESRLTTEEFILALRCVLLPWQRGWLKTRLKNSFCLFKKNPVVGISRNLAKKYFRNQVNDLSQKIWILTQGICNTTENDSRQITKIAYVKLLLEQWWQKGFHVNSQWVNDEKNLRGLSTRLLDKNGNLNV